VIITCWPYANVRVYGDRNQLLYSGQISCRLYDCNKQWAIIKEQLYAADRQLPLPTFHGQKSLGIDGLLPVSIPPVCSYRQTTSHLEIRTDNTLRFALTGKPPPI